MTFRIHRSAGPDTIVFTLSGDLNTEDADRVLGDTLSSETDDRIVLDLRDVTLVDRETVQFLARMEGRGIRIVNFPDYVRSWIAAERMLDAAEDKETDTHE